MVVYNGLLLGLYPSSDFYLKQCSGDWILVSVLTQSLLTIVTMDDEHVWCWNGVFYSFIPELHICTHIAKGDLI
jgi:hypothetical protein